MSRIAQKQTISPSMYRHFAVITLVATALIGIFASGENRDAAAEALAQAAAEKPKAAPSPAPTQAVAFRSGRRSQSWGRDPVVDDGGDGGSVEPEAYSSVRGRPENVQPPVPMSSAAQLGGLNNLPDTPPPGMPIEVYMQLKREQKRLKAAGPQVTTQADMARMTEESRQRSGGEDLPAEQAD